MNSKQRSYLKGIASTLQPVVTIGKQGLSDSVIKEINEVLELRELIKITVLKNSLLEPKAILEEVAKSCHAEPVLAIGYKIVLFRVSKRKDIEHIKLPQ